MGTDPLGQTIPADFAIPSDAYVTDHDNPSDQVLWVLHASADVPGVNYTDDFEVPVFRTGSSTEQTFTSSPSSAASGFADRLGRAAASVGWEARDELRQWNRLESRYHRLRLGSERRWWSF